MLSILYLRYAVAVPAWAKQLIKSTLQYLCLRCASEEPLADVCYLTFQFSVCDAETTLFDFCGFLSVSVVVLEFAVVGFVLVLWGLFVCDGVGVVVVVLVEVGFGVGLRFCVALRFINWISALHSLLGGRLERFDRCKKRIKRRFIKAHT